MIPYSMFGCRAQIEKSIRVGDDSHCPITRLICLENTQNACGGKVRITDHHSGCIQDFTLTELLMSCPRCVHRCCP